MIVMSNAYERANYWASMYASVACIAFVIVYSVMAPWWKSATGRLIMMLIGGLAGLAILSLVFYTYKNADLVRAIRTVLVTIVGTALWFQVGVVVRVQLRNRRN